MVPGGEHILTNVAWSRPYRLWPLGDIHWGAKACAEKDVDKTIERIKSDPRSLWLGMGDYWDLIAMRDERRWDPGSISEKHQTAYFKGLGKQMIAYAVEKFAPIKNKCLGLLQGNHEFAFSRNHDQDMIGALAENLEVPVLGYSCFKDLVLTGHGKTMRIRIMAHHGAGWARTIGGKINRLKEIVKNNDADIIFMGHVHMSADLPVVCLGTNKNCTSLTALTKLGVISGTYLRTYSESEEGESSYGERAGYEPVPLGSPCVVFEPGSGRIMVEKPMGKIGGRK